MKKPPRFLFALLPAVLASCAASVRFDVERPPLVDLRGAERLTVLPFEGGAFDGLSRGLADALAVGARNGARRGNLVFVEPRELAGVPRGDLWRRVDVFLTGRVTDVRSTQTVRESHRTIRGEDYRVYAVTLEVTVFVEYSYVCARDGSTLGTFRKTERASETAERLRRLPRADDGGRPGSGGGNRPGSGGGNRPGGGSGDSWRWNNPDWNRPGPWDGPGWFDPDWNRGGGRGGRRGGRSGSAFARGGWEEHLARVAVSRFSRSMEREIAPWTTTEERALRGRSGSGPEPGEARRLVRAGRHEQALLVYREIHGRYGNVSAGFNVAVLLAANGRFSEALDALEALRAGFLAEGRGVPRFVDRELQRMAAIVDGQRALEERRGPPAGSGVASFAVDPPRAAVANAVEVRGTVNLGLARVYALGRAISCAEDASVWPNLVASAEALDGRWSMRVPADAPSALWFAVSDGSRALYVTRTALGVSLEIALDTAEMIRLE